MQTIIAALFSFVLWLVFVGGAIAAAITHVVVCIQTANWVLLAFGIIVPPIGIIHGIGQWFGLW